MTAILRRPTGEAIRFDIVGQEEYAETNNVTEFPVEDGTAFTDHIQEKPLTISFNGVISATPYASAQKPNDRQETFAIGETPNRVQEAAAFLREAKKDVLEFISVRLGIYPVMAVVSISYTVDGVERLDFRIELKEIKIGQTVLVEVPPEAAPPPAAPVKHCGDQAVVEEKETDDSETDDKTNSSKEPAEKSFAADGVDWFKEKLSPTSSLDEGDA